MLRGTRRLAVITVAGVCLFTGCQVTTTPTPTPAPSYRCTPEAGGDEFDCTEKQYQDMVAKDELYAEAEAVYRKFLAEDLRISRSSTIEIPTQVLLETASGSFLSDAMDGYRDDRKSQITVEGGDREIKSLTRLVGLSKAGSLVALRACVDASSVEVFRKGKPFGNGLITIDDLYFGRVDSSLKIIGADGKEAASCESS